MKEIEVPENLELNRNKKNRHNLKELHVGIIATEFVDLNDWKIITDNIFSWEGSGGSGVVEWVEREAYGSVTAPKVSACLLWKERVLKQKDQ